MSLKAILTEKRNALLTQAEQITKAAEDAKRALTAEESTQFNNLMTEAKSLKNQIATQEEFEGEIAGPGRKVPAGDPTRDIPAKDLLNYSLLNAIRSMVHNRALTGLEAEVDQEIERKSGRKAQGFWMPHSLPMMKNAALTTTTGSGAVENFTDTANFIDILRAKQVLSQMGVRYVTDCVGEIDIPKQTAAATAYHVTEGSDLTQSGVTIGQVTLRAKTVGCYQDITRRMLNQTSMSVENLVRSDLATTVALAIQQAAIYGGGAGEATGVLGTIGAFSDTSLSGVTWSDVVTAETNVASGNADLGSLAYLTHPVVRGTLKTKAKFANSNSPIWEDGAVNGYPAFVSTASVANGSGEYSLIFGNWSDLVIATWGALDVLLDPISLVKSGGIRIRAIQDYDVAIRNTESFAVLQL